MRRLFKKTQKVVKGMPSAVVLSILIHAGLFLLAGLLVVFTVLPPKETTFEAPKPVKRPKMAIRKLQMKVKKPSKPKASAKITALVKTPELNEIAFPDLATGGFGTGIGGEGVGPSFVELPEFEESSVFGNNMSIGSDFEGTFYSLNHGRVGGFQSMNGNEFRDVLRKFVLSGWKDNVLSKYYRSPKKLYATHFMVPPIPAVLAPDVFGEPDKESYFFFVHYRGKLVYPEDITFRFWGIGNAYMFVRVDGKEVFVDAFPNHINYAFNWWQNNDSQSLRFYLGDRPMQVGDWITLKAGEPIDMDVLFGEWKGGTMAAMLLVEVEGVEYPRNRQNGPILPAFRTSEFTLDMVEEIQRYLAEGEASLTDEGPVFRDY
jgi:hypothetical protein